MSFAGKTACMECHEDIAKASFHVKDGVSCETCHVKPADEVKLSKECGDCHSRDDVHHGGFGRDCARCHSSVSWKGAGIRR